MAKTADVLQAIWADPWFVALPPDGKLIFLWGVTNEHSNMAGIYVVAEETIRHETKLSAARLTKALADVHPKMGYRSETGTVCVPSRPKYARVKNKQMAKSIAAAIRDCLHPEIRDFYLRKYGANAWLVPAFEELALQANSGVLHPYSDEVPSQSHSQVVVVENPFDADWQDWLEHFRETTGKTSTAGSATARRHFNARRAEGRSLADLKLATVGCHSDQHLRSQGFDRPETILQDSKVERYIALAASVGSNGRKTDPGLAKILGRAA